MRTASTGVVYHETTVQSIEQHVACNEAWQQCAELCMEHQLSQNKGGNQVHPIVISYSINMVVMNAAVILTSNSLQVANEFELKTKLQTEVVM